jgi:hypothetical protein
LNAIPIRYSSFITPSGITAALLFSIDAFQVVIKIAAADPYLLPQIGVPDLQTERGNRYQELPPRQSVLLSDGVITHTEIFAATE